jgi:multidrug efflux pump subunit AcrA (membrane-fusion protein)
VGQFVEARIEGVQLDNVFVLPRSAISQDQRLLMIEQGALVARRVEPLWSDEQVVVVGEGLQSGELVNLTPLGSSANGTKVSARIDGQPLAASVQAMSPAKE